MHKNVKLSKQTNINDCSSRVTIFNPVILPVKWVLEDNNTWNQMDKKEGDFMAETYLLTSLHLLFVAEAISYINSIVNTLQNSGFNFTYDIADTIDSCQGMLENKVYNAVISDYNLGNLTAIDVLKLIENSGQEIPLVLVADNLGEELTVECIKAGINDYVLKNNLSRLPDVLVRSLAEFYQRRQQQIALLKLQQQVIGERLLNQIIHNLNSSLDPQHILTEIVTQIGKYFGVDRVNIFSLNSEYLKFLNEWRANDNIISIINSKLFFSEVPYLIDANSAYRCHVVVHLPNCQECLELKDLPEIQQTQTLSMLRVPIFIRGQFFGGLSLQTITNYRTFTEDEIHLLQKIAEQAALALYNAKNYERLEELVKERTHALEKEKLVSETANRAKSEFLANIGHELRTPLTGILGFSHVLLEQIFGELNDKQKQYISGINSCGQHLLDLINDLLDLSKIEAGKEELSLEMVEIEEICQASIFLVRERSQEKGLKLSMSIATDVTTFIADNRRVKQILFNLLSNAVKFTEIGSVTLTVEKNDNVLKFSVLDTGIGISPENQTKLFQPFKQLDSGLARKYEGTGLGLVLSRKLANLHGGDITLVSELGKGSCFTLWLPENLMIHK